MNDLALPYFNIYVDDYKLMKIDLKKSEIFEIFDAISDLSIFGETSFIPNNKKQEFYYDKFVKNLEISKNKRKNRWNKTGTKQEQTEEQNTEQIENKTAIHARVHLSPITYQDSNPPIVPPTEKTDKGCRFENSEFYRGDIPTEMADAYSEHALKKGLSEQQALTEFQKFTAHWIGKTGEKAVKSRRGWLTAWATTWLGNAKKWEEEDARRKNIMLTDQEHKAQYRQKVREGNARIFGFGDLATMYEQPESAVDTTFTEVESA